MQEVREELMRELADIVSSLRQIGADEQDMESIQEIGQHNFEQWQHVYAVMYGDRAR